MGKSKKHSRSSDSDDSSDSESDDRRKHQKKSSKRHRDSSDDERRHKKKKKQRKRSPSQSDDGHQKKDKPISSSSQKEGGGASRGGRGSLSKIAESAEERAARKAAKEAKKIAQIFGYSNDCNPFGDSNLHEQFVWRKKEAASTGGVGPGGRSMVEESQRRLELVKEIEKVRKRREDREKEQEEMERLRAEESRLREAALYDEWEEKEEQFHRKQARVRSKIRLVEGREKPIDILAKNILLFGEEDDREDTVIKYTGKNVLDMSNVEAELREPYLIFQDLEVEELKDLQADIREYQSLEGEGPNKAFWHSLAIVCKDELKRKSGERSGLDGGGVHTAVEQELDGMFEGRSVKDLEKMRVDIQNKIDRNDGTVDVDYYEGVLANLDVYHAKAVLREIHKEMLFRQLERLEERRSDLARKKEERREAAAARGGEEEEGERDSAFVPEPEPARAGYDDSNAAMAMVTAERVKGLERDETTLGGTDEVDTSNQVYWWQDKYRPRKPRYFNRVKTGYDWNKYNQTHYDHDNPPPKTVQGYKFNIFYPDLLDKSKTPHFVLEKADHPDFCIIRFIAGPPYEDVAFKIINREWERSNKRGFKCLFERGILHLYFNFKRMRYRR